MALQLAIVTPEKTLLNQTVDSVVVPLFDGEAGILTGHAATIGRLGFGELRFPGAGGVQRFYIDGGFVQIAKNEVNVLTGRAIPVGRIDRAEVEKQLSEAERSHPNNPEERAARERSIEQARAQLRAIGHQ